MRPVVDESLCIGCGTCEELCPDVFEVGDDGFSHVIAADPVAACEKAGCCDQAAEECPVDAISLVED
jgi:ferredoxin